MQFIRLSDRYLLSRIPRVPLKSVGEPMTVGVAKFNRRSRLRRVDQFIRLSPAVWNQGLPTPLDKSRGYVKPVIAPETRFRLSTLVIAPSPREDSGTEYPSTGLYETQVMGDFQNSMDKPLPALSRVQSKIAQGAVVCSECELVGEVTIGPNTIIHPRARIVAEAGPIHIGAFNLIEEQVELINKIPGSVMKIGDHNVFEGIRRISTERPSAQTLQLDFLTKILPNYHHLIKASRPASSAAKN